MTSIIAQEYRANAKQCLSWAESASNPENRDAFFALAATWEPPPSGSRDRLPPRGSGQSANLRSAGRPRVDGSRPVNVISRDSLAMLTGDTPRRVAV